jgi:integration host factor subunit beta
MEELTGISSSAKVPTYTKRDVALGVARKGEGKVSVAEKWVDRVFATLREIMMSADPELRIEVRDFGVFEVKRTRPKPKARNPRTGEIIFVPGRRKTHFKPGKRLRRFLQQPIEKENLISAERQQVPEVGSVQGQLPGSQPGR